MLRQSLQARLLSLVFSAGFVGLSGCSEGATDPGNSGGSGGEENHGGAGEGGSSPGPDLCCTLGAVCHVVGEPQDEDVEYCHHVGHENDQAVCAEEFERCMRVCEGANSDPVEHACE